MGIQEEIKSGDVVLFQRNGCPYCRRAREALTANGVEHKVIELNPGSKQELVALTGQTSVPQVFVKGQFIGGCNDGGLGGVLPLLANGTIKKMLSS